MQVLLEQVFFDQSTPPVALGRTTCDAEGRFSFERKEPFPEGLYRLTVGARRMFFILDGREKTVSFKGDLETMERLQIAVEGSETMACYARLVQEMVRAGQISPAMAKGFIERTCTPLMKAFFTLQLMGRNAGNHLAEFKSASEALSNAMPGNAYATQFAQITSSIEQQMQQIQMAQAAGPIRIGQPAPEISLPGPDGKIRSLSSLRGKVVLIDFWASWCRPCRMANPHVVQIYHKYKDKGFDVFSVSLDRPGQKDAWIAAIKQDGLVWDNHVSDLQFWNSAPARIYGVNAIPTTFLVDRNGKIAAINPRANLEEEIKKLL
ncbi:MAG: TlpA family protein disulfide reductase [Saprospiraceae bacterium]|nr:TlpA family protein disulfide reductase [Saprospiraceae bacterium]MDW8483042.1 TlpA disulfide reductase family protein [Saprospiraceae bacterium]